MGLVHEKKSSFQRNAAKNARLLAGSQLSIRRTDLSI